MARLAHCKCKLAQASNPWRCRASTASCSRCTSAALFRKCALLSTMERSWQSQLRSHLTNPRMISQAIRSQTQWRVKTGTIRELSLTQQHRLDTHDARFGIWNASPKPCLPPSIWFLGDELVGPPSASSTSLQDSIFDATCSSFGL